MKLIEYIGDLLSGRVDKAFDAIYKVLFTKQGLNRIELLERKVNIMNIEKLQEAENKIVSAANTINEFTGTLKNFVTAAKEKEALMATQIDELKAAIRNAPGPNPPVVDEPTVNFDEEFSMLDGALNDLGKALTDVSEGASVVTDAATSGELQAGDQNQQVNGDDVADTDTINAQPMDTTQKTPDYLAGETGAGFPDPNLDTDMPNVQDQPGTSATVDVETSPSASETEANPIGNPDLAGDTYEDEVVVDEGNSFEDLDVDADTEEIPVTEGDMPTGSVSAPVDYSVDAPAQTSSTTEVVPAGEVPAPAEVPSFNQSETGIPATSEVKTDDVSASSDTSSENSSGTGNQ